METQAVRIETVLPADEKSRCLMEKIWKLRDKCFDQLPTICNKDANKTEQARHGPLNDQRWHSWVCVSQTTSHICKGKRNWSYNLHGSVKTSAFFKDWFGKAFQVSDMSLWTHTQREKWELGTFASQRYFQVICTCLYICQHTWLTQEEPKSQGCKNIICLS